MNKKDMKAIDSATENLASFLVSLQDRGKLAENVDVVSVAANLRAGLYSNAIKPKEENPTKEDIEAYKGFIDEDCTLDKIMAYNGNRVPIFSSDSGQCHLTISNGELFSLGTYNFLYAGEAVYITEYNRAVKEISEWIESTT